MSGWLDTLFGNLPPRPKQPSSRGALLGMGGYQQMPDMTAPIEDRRTGFTTPGKNPPPSPYSLNAQINAGLPPGSHAYDVDQYQWLEKHMPDDPPSTPLQDPGFSLDPSIMARAKVIAHPSWGQSDPSWGAPSPQPSYQQMIDFLSNWRGGGQ